MENAARRIDQHEHPDREAPLHARPHEKEAPLHRSGQLAVSRILDDSPRASHPAESERGHQLRSLHTKLLHATIAEFDAWHEHERQAADQWAIHGIADAEARAADGISSVCGRAWHAVGGRAPEAAPVTRQVGDHRSWNALFAQLNELDAAIGDKRYDAAAKLLSTAAKALLREHDITLASANRRAGGADHAVDQLRFVVSTCVTIESACTGGLAGAGAGLVKVAALSAVGGGVARAGVTLAETAFERLHGFEDHQWIDALKLGGEEALTMLVSSLVGGALSARFVPRFARFAGEHLSAEQLAHIGNELGLIGPVPRSYFAHQGRFLLDNFLCGAGTSLITAPVRVVYEQIVFGKKLTIDQFLDQLELQMLLGGVFQAVIAGAFQAQAIRPGNPRLGPTLPAGAPEEAHLEDLLGHGNMKANNAALDPLVAAARSDAAVAPAVAALSDAELKAVIGYTGEDYAILNVALRTKDPRLLEALRPYIALARQGLGKMPRHQGWCYRGLNVPKSVATKYKVGAIVTEDGFTSTATTKGTEFGGNVQMKIQSKSAAEITPVSQYKATETEALFQPGARFEVVKRVDLSDGTVHVMLDEVIDEGVR